MRGVFSPLEDGDYISVLNAIRKPCGKASGSQMCQGFSQQKHQVLEDLLVGTLSSPTAGVSLSLPMAFCTSHVVRARSEKEEEEEEGDVVAEDKKDEV